MCFDGVGSFPAQPAGYRASLQFSPVLHTGSRTGLQWTGIASPVQKLLVVVIRELRWTPWGRQIWGRSLLLKLDMTDRDTLVKLGGCVL